MVKITLSQAILISIWVCIFSFVCSVGSDVFDHAPQDLCEFCAISNRTSRTRLLYENETTNIIAFRSKDPDCKKHYLITPHLHIKNYFSPEATCDLIHELQRVCHEMLDEEGIKYKRRILFHIPPFYSVTHLHLHCMACTNDDESFLSSQYYINKFMDFASPDIEDKCPHTV